MAGVSSRGTSMFQTGLGRHFLASCFLLAAVVVSPLALAQVTSTSIRGTVKDTSGAVIPNAALKLVDTSTGSERQTVSGDEGAFVVATRQARTHARSAFAPRRQLPL